MSSLPLSSPTLASHTLRRDHEHRLCEGDWFQSLIYCFHRAVRAGRSSLWHSSWAMLLYSRLNSYRALCIVGSRLPLRPVTFLGGVEAPLVLSHQHFLLRDHSTCVILFQLLKSLVTNRLPTVLEQPIQILWIDSRLGAMRLPNVDSQTSNASSIDQRRFAPGSPASAAN